MTLAATPRHRVALGVVIVAVLAVAAAGSFVVLNRGGDKGHAAASGPTTTIQAVAGDSSPPELKNTGEDWDQIVRSIYAYQAWLFTHPRAELLDNIMLPSYDGYADQKLGLMNLATKGWRYDPEFRAATTELVRLQDRPRSDVAVVFVRSFLPPNRVVDPHGNVVLDTPGAGESSVLWTLQRDPPSSERWRLSKVTPFTEAPAKP